MQVCFLGLVQQEKYGEMLSAALLHFLILDLC